ncbi:MAG: Fe-S protein assembly chaperone HscA [Myxococcota bacterium]
MGNDDQTWNDPGALFQIEEPSAPSQGAQRHPGRGIGIDLGTTHSLVAIAPHGASPRALPDARGRVLLPSVVSYLDEAPQVGDAAQQRRVDEPARVLSSVKRFMGRGIDDVGFAHGYQVAPPGEGESSVIRFDVGGDRQVTPVEVSAEILRVLAARAKAELAEPVAGAVITVPAYFDDAQRQATKDAGRVAGLTVYRLLAEPTAAALAYGLDKGGQGLFAVYDLGGGTFDISILRLRDGVFQVLATGGDSALGGDDFDRALAEHLLLTAGVASADAHQREEALVQARAAKEALTDTESVRVQLTRSRLPGYALTRATLETILEPVARRTLAPCRQALKDAGVRARELDGVVLVGGSTRVPLVRRLVESTFRQPPLSDIDPDKVVAYGAAIQADILSGSEREGVTLLDVVPLSLGLETMGGIVEKIIPRNATIPIAARQVFTNYSEKQTGMVVHVVQGERELAADCRSLARFELRGLPRLPPSMARIEVSFQLDADALLTVTARELMTGIKQTVEVKPTYGLSEEQVDLLVMDSLDHAEEDFDARNLAEARVELGRVVLAVRTALQEVGDLPGLLPAAEREAIEAALAAADQAMGPDGPREHRAINAAREALEEVSEPFARRRMERALRSGMSGKSLAEIESALADEAELEARRASHDPELTTPG